MICTSTWQANQIEIEEHERMMMSRLTCLTTENTGETTQKERYDGDMRNGLHRIPSQVSLLFFNI